MFNYQIIIEYLGTDFVGWQIQKNGSSIQSHVQRALSKVLKSKIKINKNPWGFSSFRHHVSDTILLVQ